MSEITISGHVSTADALKYILKFNIIIVRNSWRFIDGLVHRFTWVCIGIVVAASVLISLVQIGRARAERDSYNQKNIHLTQKVTSYEALLERN